MHLEVKKQDIKFYFNILIQYKAIEVITFSNFFDSAHLSTFKGWLTTFVQCIAQIKINSDLLEF
jgi:hypothetical protein